MSSRPKALIVGAGYTGLSAAFELASAGIEVEVFEQDAEIGGLAGAFELTPGHRLEKFYHHWFESDRAVLGFIEELGLGSSIRHLSSKTGLFYANSIFRLQSPLDLLRFSPLPFIDRVRTGVMALIARRVSDWKPLEDISAKEWICKYGGKKAYEVIWEPLLVGKFGDEAPNVSAVWFWNKLKLRGSSRDSAGNEQLVYFDGGFDALTKGIRNSLAKLPVTIHTNCPVVEILSENGKATGLRLEGETKSADAVLSTVPLPQFLDITPGLAEDYVALHRKIRFLGNVCLVLRLNRSLSDTYWLNVADPSFPFVGIIEHTNFDNRENYGGEHIAYISKYLPTTDEMYAMGDQELFEFCLPHIQRIIPPFERSWVNGFHAWRAEYSQPVITKHYSSLIPDIRTPIEKLWLSTMAQIYPQDRGTNYAVEHGRMVARAMKSELLA